jgi:hypothetical protein
LDRKKFSLFADNMLIYVKNKNKTNQKTPKESTPNNYIYNYCFYETTGDKTQKSAIFL